MKIMQISFGNLVYYEDFCYKTQYIPFCPFEIFAIDAAEISRK